MQMRIAGPVSYSWDDVAILVALLDERTTGRAAAKLGCSQPTIVRRIAALEAAIGLRLFERGASGFAPTDAARALEPAARRFEQAACEFECEAATERGDTSQTVRLTLLDHFENLLVPILRAYRLERPEVRVQLLASDRIFDIAKGEADIAIRGRALDDEEASVPRRLPDCAWTLFAAADMAESERPGDWGEARGHILALLDGQAGQLPAYRKLEQLVEEGADAIRCSNFMALRSAILSGSALSVLPVTIGDSDPQLARCFPPPPEFDVPIWLIGRRAALRRAHVRELFDRIDAHFQANPALLTGRGG
jgi:DNA-binding transcriptional LysR family regulator